MSLCDGTKLTSGVFKKRVKDDSGVTSVGMAVSIFLSIALIFSGAQLYKVESASAEIQEVADACALAADNEIAEFVTAVNVCDAVILSMTLLSGSIYGIGLVAACVPPLEALSVKLMEMGKKVVDARDSFYDQATTGLNTLQRALPFLASANAAQIAKDNDQGAMQGDYFALAALVPSQGLDINKPADDGMGDLVSEIEDSTPEIREKAAQAEIAAEKANDLKEQAFMADCGRNPERCMYERAASLASLAGEDNPLYSSVDAWSFQVAINRIQAYYEARYANPSVLGSSVEAQADSVIRERFYRYAIDEMSSAYVSDIEGAFDIHIPHLFRNTEEMRSTELYTEAIYPITEADGAQSMHAWGGCPNASGAIGTGSIAQLEAGSFSTCPLCKFVPSSMGNVASASTSIDNGFEYHLEEFRQASEEYKEARCELDDLKAEVEQEIQPLMDSMSSIFKDAAAKRLVADPAGKYGVISLVVNRMSNPADSGFESLFVDTSSTLGTRGAVAGATLLPDETSQGSSVITRILSGLSSDGGAGAIGIVGSIWTGLLRAYEGGQSAFEEAVESGLNQFSANSASGLGTWAKVAFQSIISSSGLAPADISSKLPVLVNSGHIASADSGAFATNFMQVKSSALASSTSYPDAISALADKVAGAVNEKLQGDWMTIAQIELPIGGDSYQVEWILPDSVKNAIDGSIDRATEALRAGIESLSPERSWQ